jgi:bifunctional non-homologous end joining protein LigD
MHARLDRGGVRPDGATSFSLIQTASDTGIAEALVFFLFDILHLDGNAVAARPLEERKERLRDLLSQARSRPAVPVRSPSEFAMDSALDGIRTVGPT